MLSFHIEFIRQKDRRIDRQMDNGKTICPTIFRYRGIKTKCVCETLVPMKHPSSEKHDPDI